MLHVQQANNFKTAYEEPYLHLNPKKWNQSGDKYTLLPILIEAEKKYKILISEADLSDYPAMFLTPKGGAESIEFYIPEGSVEI